MLSGLEQSLRVISGSTGATLNLTGGLPRQKVAMAPHVNVSTTLHATAQQKSGRPGGMSITS